MTDKIKSYAALYLIFFLSSIGNVLTKLASEFSFLSMRFILLYGSSLFLTAVYAVGWQQIIKGLPLTVAYANRASLVVFGMLWGLIFFGETIKWNMLLGAVVIFLGIVLLVHCDEQ